MKTNFSKIKIIIGIFLLFVIENTLAQSTNNISGILTASASCNYLPIGGETLILADVNGNPVSGITPVVTCSNGLFAFDYTELNSLNPDMIVQVIMQNGTQIENSAPFPLHDWFTGSPVHLFFNEITITVSQINPSCFNSNNGAISITVTGGTTPYTFLWNNGATTEDLSGLGSGTYTVTVTDANNCIANTSVAITEPQLLEINSANVTNVLCYHQHNGIITVIANGGTGTLNYSINTTIPQTNQTGIFSGLSIGNYTITVTDANGCQANINATVTQPPLLSSFIFFQNVACYGGNTGNANVSAFGGTSPYSYTWSNGQTGGSAVNLTAGIYTVTVTDANNCTAIASVSITQPAALTATISGLNVACNGELNGTANLTVNGGSVPYTYIWSNSAITEDISGLGAGSFTVTVTDNKSCTANTSITITQPDALIATISSTNVFCNGENSGAANLNISGGTPAFNFTWSNGSVTEDITNLTAGTYSVIINDANNCTANASINITEPDVLTTSLTGTDLTCFGDNSGSVVATVTGGTFGEMYQFAWSNGSANPGNISGLQAGTYTLTVTDDNNCQTITSTTITEPSVLNILVQINNTCANTNSGYIVTSVGGGIAPYTYLWNTGQTISNIYNLVAGTYSVTVTDNNGCNISKTVTVLTLNTPVITLEDAVFCSDPIELTAAVDQGYYYQWYRDGVFLPMYIYTPTIIISNASQVGYYTVNVLDNTTNYCHASGSALVTYYGGAPSLISQGQNPIITGTNVIWDHNLQINEEVNITAGAKLTITNSAVIEFGIFGRIIVESKGKLIVENATLRGSDVCNSSWNGITLVGGASDVQTQNTQSYLKLNNCTIQDAWTAVAAVKNSIIDAQNSTFRNNCVAIYFIGNSLLSSQGVSRIKNCAFITDNNDLTQQLDNVFNPDFNTSWPKSFINLRKVINLNIEANSFINSSTMYNETAKRGNGIIAFNSSFNVIPTCLCPSSIPGEPCMGTTDDCFAKNHFEGLNYAIQSNSTISSVVEVNRCDFTNNFRAMLFSGTNNNPTVKFNDIDINSIYVPTPPDEPMQYFTSGYGLYISQCKNFTVQENFFHKDGTSRGDAGMFVFSTRSSSHIYHNRFENINSQSNNSATISLGNNNVLYKCNKFGRENAGSAATMGNRRDMSVVSYTASGNPISSKINTKQGEYYFPLWYSAKNMFLTNNCAIGNNAFLSNNNIHYNYYFNQVNDITDFKGCHSNTVTSWATNAPFIESQDCPILNDNSIIIASPGAKSGGSQSFIAPLNNILNSIDSLQQILRHLIDGGNTQSLLNRIQNATNGSFTSLCNKLTDDSPYLSDTVLLSFMRDIRIFNSLKKKNVLLANSPLPERAKEELDNVNLPLQYINEIKLYQNGTYPRELKEQEMESLESKKQNIIGELVNTSLRDTTGSYLSTLIDALEDDDDYRSKLVFISLLITENNYQNAQHEIEKLENHINNLSEELQTEIENIIQFQTLNVTLGQTPDSLKNNVILANEIFLTTLAGSEDKQGSVDAALLLQEAGIKKYYERLVLPDDISARFINPAEGDKPIYDYALLETENISIYPNPANDKLFIEISESVIVCDGIIEIFTLQGKFVKSTIIEEQVCSKTIDVPDLATGEYLISITCNNEKLLVKKITIIK